MASSDAGTSLRSEYDVFLNFGGLDNCTEFADLLYHSLTDAGIYVFRDGKEHHVDKKFDASLQRVIAKSRIYIPIFSRTYASSQWCLDELVEIMLNTFRSEGEKVIFPIFFDVQPDDVKLKTPLYNDAILILERDKKFCIKQVDMWREALTKVAAVKGWEVKRDKSHGKLIMLVVKEVIMKLKIRQRLVIEYLVGIDDRVVAIQKLLDVNSGGVQFIQIHGVAGIGKTTLAKVVFNQLVSCFGKSCCFLENVRAVSSIHGGLIELQKKLLLEIGHPMGSKSIDEIDYGMKRIGEVLCNKKVLLVLDDVDNSKQIEALVGKMTLNSGSRILITTRNRDVLQLKRSNYEVLCYEMEVMSTDHALKLFSMHAFNSDYPSDNYNHLAREIVSTIGRLPSALEVIGLYLYNKTQELWIEKLDELRKGTHEDVFGMLKINYDTLSFEGKQIFLDVACFFIGEDMTNAMYMWRDCGFSPNASVDALIGMSWLKIVDNNKFWLHDQIRDFGREIVRRENPANPGKRSRIWIGEEVLDAIKTEEMRSDVQALYLDLHESHLKDVIESEDIEKFEYLRYLKLNWGTFVGDLTNCLTKLRWFCWSCPFPTSKPTNMHLKSVVILEFSDNDFIDELTLQSMIKMARKLKVLSLTSCNKIIKTPDFSGCLNLERLSFDFCSKLRKIEGSIEKLKHLIELRITFCNGLEDLPEEIGNLVNLEYFFVHHCKVKKLPDSIWKLKSLREVHFSSNFDGLDSENSWELPNAIGMLQNLEVLLVNSRSLKGQLPHEIGSLCFLRILDLSKTGISEVPKTVSILPCLEKLELMGCDEIQELPMLPSSLTHLLVSSASLQVLPDLSNLINLVNLVLSDWEGGGDRLCIGELRWIGGLSNNLSLRLYNVPAHAELASLPLLNQLGLFGFDLQTIPHVPSSLKELGLDNFNSIVSLSLNLRNLSRLDLSISPIKEFQLDGLQLPNIRQLLLIKCVALKRFKLSSTRKLKNVNVVDCPKLIEIQFSGFESLEILYIQQCESFERLIYVGKAWYNNHEYVNKLISCEGRLIFPWQALDKLRSFFLSGCPKIFEIQIVGTSESWEYFSLVDCPHVRSLSGLSNLKNLKRLRIEGNKWLQFVKGPHELEYLDESRVYRHELLERGIESSTKLPNHSHVQISGCQKDFRGLLESYKHHKTNEDVIDR